MVINHIVKADREIESRRFNEESLYQTRSLDAITVTIAHASRVGYWRSGKAVILARDEIQTEKRYKLRDNNLKRITPNC